MVSTELLCFRKSSSFSTLPIATYVYHIYRETDMYSLLLMIVAWSIMHFSPEGLLSMTSLLRGSVEISCLLSLNLCIGGNTLLFPYRVNFLQLLKSV